MSLPPKLEKSLTATATIAVAELFSEGKSAANDPAAWPLAQINETLDSRQCPLCAAVDGKVLQVGSPEYYRWKAPSHINCRRVLVYISRDENREPNFQEPAKELVQKHGHYLIDPEKHAELRLPAEPASRNVIVRRVKNLETGQVETRLQWAPWFDAQPEWKRDLVLKARAAPDVELQPIFTKLGLNNLDDPAQLRQATLLGLKDRAEGFVDRFPGPPWNNPFAPTFTKAQDNPEGEKWALAHIPGLKRVDYSGMELRAVNEVNRVVSDIATKFGLKVENIAPKDWDGWPRTPEPLVSMQAFENGLSYDQDTFQDPALRLAERRWEKRPHVTSASRGIAAYVAHEMAHVLHLQPQGTVEPAARRIVIRLALDYRNQMGEAGVRKELGNYAWDRHPLETWCEAFSAYWDEIYSIDPLTKAFVEKVLQQLFPNVTL